MNRRESLTVPLNPLPTVRRAALCDASGLNVLMRPHNFELSKYHINVIFFDDIGVGWWIGPHPRNGGRGRSGPPLAVCVYVCEKNERMRMQNSGQGSVLTGGAVPGCGSVPPADPVVARGHRVCCGYPIANDL